VGSLQPVRDELGRYVGAMKSPRPAERSAMLARRMIIDRTRRGLDRHGRRFARYRTKGRESERVDLTDTRKMLDRMEVRRALERQRGDYVQAFRVTPRSGRDHRLTIFHTRGTRRGLPVRDYFGLTERQAAHSRRLFKTAALRELPTDRRSRITIVIGR
jgi:hypothetical protein